MKLSFMLTKLYLQPPLVAILPSGPSTSASNHFPNRYSTAKSVIWLFMYVAMCAYSSGADSCWVAGHTSVCADLHWCG